MGTFKVTWISAGCCFYRRKLNCGLNVVAGEIMINFVQTFWHESLLLVEYINFYRKMLKPMKIVLRNKTPCSRRGISVTLRASCVLIVRSACRIWALSQVQIPFLIVWQHRAGGCSHARRFFLPWRMGQGWFWLFSKLKHSWFRFFHQFLLADIKLCSNKQLSHSFEWLLWMNVWLYEDIWST